MTAFQPIELLPVTEAEELQLGAGCMHVSVRKFLLKLIELGLLAVFFHFSVFDVTKSTYFTESHVAFN